MVTIKTNCEFASELVCVVPYANWLHHNNKLEKVITSKGMKPFYYFCDNVEEVFGSRTFDSEQNGLDAVPNYWVHHNALPVFGKLYSEMTEEEKTKANGVLDYTQSIAPSYKKEFDTREFDELKPYVVISNNYNIEAGNDISETRRYFNLETLSNLFYYFHDIDYNVIYKRPDNTEFAPDQNEMSTLLGGHRFEEKTDLGVITDYDLCERYGNVYNFTDLSEGKNYNEVQMECFSNAEGFVTPNGGGGILCACFDKPVVFYVPSGKETRPGYLTNENSYINKLSSAKIHVTKEYSELIKEVKEVFK